MNQKETKPVSDLRPLWLTAALCALSVLAALDITYGTCILGHLVLPCAAGLLCVIYMTCEKHIFVLDAAAMLVILFFTSSGELSLSLFGVVLIVAALILAVLVRKRCTKITAVLAVCVTIAVGYVTVLAVFYAADGNSLAPGELLSKLNAYFDSFKAPLADMVRQSIEEMPETTLAYYEKHEITKEMLLETSLASMEAYVDMAQMLLPGCFLFIVQVLGYISVVSFERTVKLSRYDALLPEVRWSLYPSQFSCGVYLVVMTVYVITMFFASSVFTVIVTNVWITLSPVMVACGVRGLILRLKHPRFRRSTVVILVVFVFSILFLREAALSFGLMMLAFTGAQDVFAARSAEAMKMRFDDKNQP